MVDDTASWMEQAHLDFEAARYNGLGGHFAVAAFLAQQAAEKALKAAYIKSKDRLWRTHDLTALAEQLDAPAVIREACEILSPHYVATRYPVTETREYNEEVSEIALEASERIIEWVEESV